jgi:hypothetical protein
MSEASTVRTIIIDMPRPNMTRPREDMILPANVVDAKLKPKEEKK